MIATALVGGRRNEGRLGEPLDQLMSVAMVVVAEVALRVKKP